MRTRTSTIDGGTRTEFLPFARPTISDEEIRAVVETLESGWLSTGPKVKEFEAAVAQYVGAAHAVAVSSCTAGLHLSLQAMGVGRGDEVIVPTMTFCSTANVVEHLGATPVLVDCGPQFMSTAAQIRGAITERTKAIMPVHFGGQPVDLPEILAVAAEHDLAVVEDAAHAIGSSYGDHRVGADALVPAGVRRTVVFSFYATKNITTGEGGMVVTTDEDLAAEVRQLSLHGMSRDAWKRYTSTGSWYYEVVSPGYKANMTDIQAALGLCQLDRLDEFAAARRHQAALYDSLLADVAGIVTPQCLPGRDHIHHLYVIRVDAEQAGVDRQAMIDGLRERNVGTSVHFIPVHLHPYYAERYGLRPDDLPNANAVFAEIVSLPIYPLLDDADIEYSADAVRGVVQSGGAR